MMRGGMDAAPRLDWESLTKHIQKEAHRLLVYEWKWDAHHAEDVAQDASAALLNMERIQSLALRDIGEDAWRMRALVRTLVYRAAVDKFRQVERSVTLTGMSLDEQEERTKRDSTEDIERIRQAVASGALSKNARFALDIVSRGISMRKAAEEHQIPLSTVHRRCVAGLQEIAALLQ
jgi:DNA-directed RNA polymerase specialized sigma24 family protein